MDDQRVRERATVTRYEPPVYGLDEPMWVAEDDESRCVGVGRVRAEAVGNLLAVAESHGGREARHVKLPGKVVEGNWDEDGGLLDRLRERVL